MSIEKPISKSTLFVDGAARFKDLIYIVARDRGLQDEAFRLWKTWVQIRYPFLVSFSSPLQAKSVENPKSDANKNLFIMNSIF